ncbi:MAG: hypothetical protein ACFBSC_12765 [Microcoleaceae cyanobacterium]
MLVEKDSSGSFSQPPIGSSSSSMPNPEAVQIMLKGPRQAVTQMIQLLHCKEIIFGSEWSSAVPIKNSSEVICVAVRMI